MHNRIGVYPCQAELWRRAILNYWSLVIQWGLPSYYPVLSETTDCTIFLFERLMLPPDIWCSTEVLTLSRPQQCFITHTLYFHTSSFTFFPMQCPRQRLFHSTHSAQHKPPNPSFPVWSPQESSNDYAVISDSPGDHFVSALPHAIDTGLSLSSYCPVFYLDV